MTDVVIITLALCATGLPLWMGARYGLLPLVSPMHLLGYFCAMGFLLKVLVYAWVPDLAFYRRFTEEPQAGLAGALYLTLFIVMICLGYRLAVGSGATAGGRAAARHSAAGLTRQGALCAGAFGIAVLTAISILRTRGIAADWPAALQVLNAQKEIAVNAQGVGATLAGIKTFFVVPKCVFVLLLAHGLSVGDRRSLTMAAALASVLVLVALISGDRFELVELCAYGAITYLIIDGHMRVRALLIMALATGAVLMLSAYMTNLRGAGAGLLHQMIGATYFLDINVAVMVTDRVRPATQLWGDSYGWWTFGWVPRAVWPDKPAIDLGVFFKREVMGVPTGGGYNVTGPGEAFINFGWWGVWVGCVLGWVYRRVEVLLLDPRHCLRWGSFLFYPLIFYPFVQATLQSSFSAFVVGGVAQTVLIVALILCSLPRYRLIGTAQRFAYDL